MTGRNLHEEAGSGNGVGGGCQTQKEGSEKEIKVPFSLEKESLFWVFKKKKKKKEVARTTGVGRVRGRAGAAAEMTIQSQDTAEDCTAPSGELGRERGGRRSCERAALESPARWAASPL